MGFVAHPVNTYPEQYELVARPAQTPPQDLVVATTYGFLISHDGGVTWRWGCEAGFGVVDAWAPEYELTSSGAITATTAGGLMRSPDGCTWTAVGGAAGTDVASTTAVGADGTIFLGSGVSPAVILRSIDDGLTFQPTGALGDNLDWIETIAVAPSNAMRVYATGSAFVGARQLRMWRSDDGGTSWVPLATAALLPTESSELQIAAIDPDTPDRVFVRVTNAAAVLEEAVFRSDDAGAGWTEVLRVSDNVTGVVARASGPVVAATRHNGLHGSLDGAGALALLPGRTFTATCLQELRDGQLWLCADNFGADRMGLGRSSDAEAWTPVMTMLDLAGPIPCAAGTVQADDCNRGAWCFYKDLYSIPSDEVSCVAPDAGIGGDDPPPGCIDCSSGGKGATSTWILVIAALVVRAGAARCARAHGRRSRK
ncbi:MAG TPA: sialidase family protein [Kofleriaceae bacterium]|nr:sialidase family protein [Kofleriaceae bacterium]